MSDLTMAVKRALSIGLRERLRLDRADGPHRPFVRNALTCANVARIENSARIRHGIANPPLVRALSEGLRLGCPDGPPTSRRLG